MHILVLSWAPDAQWLEFALRSVQRFARGFSGVTVVYPTADDAIMRPICLHLDARPLPREEPPPPLGHLGQNIAKCEADLLVPEGTTHVLHLDSDAIFVTDVTPDTYMCEGRPILVHRRWEDCGPATCWREPTRRALGWDPPFETMARMPLVFDVRAYGRTREHVARTHGVPFEQYVLGCKPTYPYGFCEFCTIGAFVLEKAPDLCAGMLVGQPYSGPWDGLPHKVSQGWSHDEMTPAVRAWLEETIETGGPKRPRPPPGPMTERRRKLLGL